MKLSLNNLFKNEDTAFVASKDPVSTNSIDTISKGETYKHYGKKMSTSNNGNVNVLAPHLHSVYTYVHKKQAGDEGLQQARRNKIKSDITICENNIENDKKQIAGHQEKINNLHNEKSKLEDEITEIKKRGHVIAPAARAKMIIGLVILIPLTIYLFLFYSSTFFSAFLAGNNSIRDAAGAMFNAHCFETMWGTSIAEFFFMLFFPVIFLGLGFGLHFFSEEKSNIKYLKMAAIVLVTFMFDCILAYQIGEKIHEYKVLNDIIPEGEYTISLAIHDPNTWAVIFCGFIAYIIWGIVFDQSMNGYAGLNQNKIEIEAIKSKIYGIDNEIVIENNSIKELENSITKQKNEIATLTNKLNTNIVIDENEIKACMTDFFGGWMSGMEFLELTKEKQGEAKGIFHSIMQTYGF